jgi:hypothetical protein
VDNSVENDLENMKIKQEPTFESPQEVVLVDKGLSSKETDVARVVNHIDQIRKYFDLHQEKIHLLFVAQLKSLQGENYDSANLNPDNLYKLSFHLGDNLQVDRERIRKALDDITKVRYQIEGVNRFGYIVPFPYAMFENNTITLKIQGLVLKQYLDISKGYTNILIGEALKLESEYSIKLFTNLNAWLNLGEKVYEISYLRQLLGMNEPLFENYKFVNLYLKRCKKEIEKKTSLRFDWEISHYTRGKRKPIAEKVKFSITTENRLKRQLELNFEQETKQTIRDEKKLHTDDTISYYLNAESVEEKWRLLNNAISNYGFKQDEKDYILTNALNQDFIYKFMEVHIYLQYEGMLALKEQRKPAIANFTAYFRKSMKNSGFWI